MSFEHITALALFAFVSTFTPGPNNIMLMTSGANVGFRRSIPHMLGITFGFGLMLLLVGVGLMGIFNAYPVSHQILKYASLAYLIYLAWRIARSGKAEANEDYQPMSFIAAASFQWINPKGWSMALTAVSMYSDGQSWWQLVLISIVFMIVNVPSATFWTSAGTQLQRWLTSSFRVKSFNYVMAGLLVLSTIPMM